MKFKQLKYQEETKSNELVLSLNPDCYSLDVIDLKIWLPFRKVEVPFRNRTFEKGAPSLNSV